MQPPRFEERSQVFIGGGAFLASNRQMQF